MQQIAKKIKQQWFADCKCPEPLYHISVNC